MENINSMQQAHIDIHGAFSDSVRTAAAISDSVSRIHAVKGILQAQRDLIRAGRNRRGSGKDTVEYLTEMVDALIRILWDRLEIIALPSDNLVALVAVGGYGRKELCPKSDIDLLILTSSKIKSSETQQAEYLIRSLWDFGFEVGPSVRSVAQCREAILSDPETAISFLDERFLCGNHGLYREYRKLIWRQLVPRSTGRFIKHILEQRKMRTRKYGGLIQLLEPNLKEGNGGIRDVHALLWMARLKFKCLNLEDLVREGLLSPQELEDIRSGYDFLLLTRSYLHFLTGKNNDILAFSVQPDVAREFGFTEEMESSPVEIFLKFFYRHTKAINRVTEAFISRWEKPSVKASRINVVKRHAWFTAKDGTLALNSGIGNPFRDNIPLILEYFDMANDTGLGFHSHAFHRLQQAVHIYDRSKNPPEKYIAPFLSLCKRKARVGRMLRCMHDVGLLELLIPEFSHIAYHAQYSRYHIYTTDEHTLTTVRQLAYLPNVSDKSFDLLKSALSQVGDLDVLIMACIFHDTGKSLPGDHRRTGAAMAIRYMKKAGFAPRQCRETALLVKHHLIMNEIAQRRNLEDPRTLMDFVHKVKYPATLHKLYVLTYCDSSSVHPDGWSDWKASLLQSLYLKALDKMKDPIIAPQFKVDYGVFFKEGLALGLDSSAIRFHIQNMPRHYFSSVSAKEAGMHVQMAQTLTPKSPILWFELKSSHLALNVVAVDNSRLLLALTASIARMRLSILSAEIYTRLDGIAVDRFNLALSPESVKDLELLERRFNSNLKKYILMSRENPESISRSIRLPKLRTNEKDSLHVPVGIEFSNKISKQYSTVDLSCQDHIGLVFLVAMVFSNLSLNIHGAICTTEAGVAMDAFYITDLNDSKIIDPAKIHLIKQNLERELFA